ncbi:uncharacterized protein [Macaca nemestrina]|uniref:uncharacterized protein n=1 Tax=Macaca nemestrina TaxID=9545 RepID=UPI0039B8608A
MGHPSTAKNHPAQDINRRSSARLVLDWRSLHSPQWGKSQDRYCLAPSIRRNPPGDPSPASSGRPCVAGPPPCPGSAVCRWLVQQQGDDVDERDQLVLLKGTAAQGPGIHGCGTAVVEHGHGEVGCHRVEGLAAACDPPNAQDDHQHPGVGEQDEEQGQQQQAGHQEDVLLWGPGPAGQHQHGREVTEDVVDQAATAEGQLEDGRGEAQGRDTATRAAGGQQAPADVYGHELRVVERAADGQVAVEGHGSQQQALGAPQGHKEAHLGSAGGRGRRTPASMRGVSTSV